MSQEVELLRAASDLIEKDGHCKGELKDYEGRHCAAGAVMEVAGNMSGVYPRTTGSVRRSQSFMHVQAAIDMVGAYLDEGSNYGYRWPVVVAWNNANERTAEEVIDTFRTVANLHDTTSVEERQPQCVEVTA